MSTPDTPGLVHRRQAAAVEICRDVFAGTRTIRAKRAKYLPRFPRETDANYDRRTAGAVLHNAFRRTVKGLMGMIFRKPPVLHDDIPPEILEHFENIDLAGRHLDTFARDVAEDAQVDGHAHILVEFPRLAVGEAATLDDERKSGARPYWISLKKQDVVRFRTATIAGKVTLTQFAYVEPSSEPDDEGFEEAEVLRVRQYTLTPTGVVLDVWRQTGEGWDQEVEKEELKVNGDPLKVIPVSTVYTGRTGYMQSDPPLEDLAHENVLHFQVRSDRQNSLHICGTPIPVFIGRENTDKVLEVGSNTGIDLPTGGDAKYLEPTGSALSEMREELSDIEQRMAAMGLSMLVRQTRAAETAEAKRMDKSEGDSQLSAAARDLEDALEEAAGFHAMWMGLDSGGSLEVNRDFESTPLDASTLQVLATMVGDGKLSIETLWDLMVAGELLPDGFDPEAEKERLGASDAEALARLIQEAQKREEAEAADVEEEEPELEGVT